MRRIGIRALRADAAAFVRAAGSGERIVITVAGRPLAQLGPVEPTGADHSLVDLAARGQVMAPRRDDRPAPGFTMPTWAGTRLDTIVREVRGR